MLATLRLDPARAPLISGFVDSYLRLSAQEMQELLQSAQMLPLAERETVMPLTISWKEEGRAEGRVEGRVEGRTEGARLMLRLAVEKRLGIPSGQQEARLAAIDSIERLEQMMRRLYQAESWDDLLAGNA